MVAATRSASAREPARCIGVMGPSGAGMGCVPSPARQVGSTPLRVPARPADGARARYGARPSYCRTRDPALARQAMTEPEPLVRGFDHVQVTIPRGTEERARAFYGTLLGLKETAKPGPLGRSWWPVVRGPGLDLHLGVEEPFTPATKAHIALLVRDLAKTRSALGDAGVVIVADDADIGIARFYALDPFGNRLKFISEGDRGFTGKGTDEARSTCRSCRAPCRGLRGPNVAPTVDPGQTAPVTGCRSRPERSHRCRARHRRSNGKARSSWAGSRWTPCRVPPRPRRSTRRLPCESWRASWRPAARP